MLPEMWVKGAVLPEKLLLVGSGSSYPPQEHSGVSPGEQGLVKALPPPLRSWTGPWVRVTTSRSGAQEPCGWQTWVTQSSHRAADVQMSQCCSKCCCPAAAPFLLQLWPCFVTKHEHNSPRAASPSQWAPPCTEQTEYNQRAGNISKLLLELVSIQSQ